MPDIEKGITITFRGNTASFDDSVGNIEKALKVVQADTKALNKELKLDPTNIDKLNDKLKNLNAILQLQEKELGYYKKAIMEAIEPSKELANSAEYKKMTSDIEKAELSVSNLQKELKLAKEQGVELRNPQEWEELNQKYSDAKVELEGLNDQMFDLVSKDYTVLDWKAYTDNMRQMQQTAGETAKTMSSIQNVTWKIDNNELYKTSEHFKTIGEKAKSASSAIKAVADATKWVSAAAAGALVGAIKAAGDFEQAWIKVQKVVSPTANTSYEDLQNQIKEMAKTIPVDIETIANAFANAGQLGVNADNLKEFAETMLRLGSATNFTADEAATTIAQLYNVIGEDIGSVDKFANALVFLGNTSATTEKDILEMSSTIGASAKNVGFTTSQILGLADALAGAGLNPSSAGTAISNILTNIDKKFAASSDTIFEWSESNQQWLGGLTDKLKEYIRLTGIAFDDNSSESMKNAYEQFQQMWSTDAAGTFEKLVGGIVEASDAGENLNLIFEALGISGIKQDQTLKALVNSYPLLETAMNNATTAFEEGNDAVEESDTAWGTFYSQLQLLKNNLKILGMELGETILPFISDIVTKVTEWIQGFQGMSSTTKTVISVILGLVAALSPVLSIASKVLGIFANLNLAFGTAILKLPSLGGLITKVGALFNPWVAVIGAIIALVVTFRDELDLLMYALFDPDWWNGVKQNFQELWEFIKTLCGWIIDLFTGIIKGIGWILDKIWSAISALGKAKKNSAGNTYDGKYEYNDKDIAKAFAPLHTLESGGIGLPPLMMAGGTSLSLQTTIQVNNNGTPIDEQEIRRWGNVITDMVSDNLGKRW